MRLFKRYLKKIDNCFKAMEKMCLQKKKIVQRID